MGNYITLTDDTFDQEVLKSDKPVLVDFWAEWCMPCKMIAPIMEELAKDYNGQVKIAKLDIDENNQTASQFQVMSIPSLLLYKDGEVVERIVGVVPKEQIEGILDSYVKSN